MMLDVQQQWTALRQLQSPNKSQCKIVTEQGARPGTAVLHIHPAMEAIVYTFLLIGTLIIIFFAILFRDPPGTVCRQCPAG
jgi:hypothetical protein